MAHNTVMSHEQIARVAPSVFASEAASNRSDRIHQIATLADIRAPNGKANIAFINREFRKHDQSHLYPINNRFNATERAIRKAAVTRRETGDCDGGLAYCYLLDGLLSEIVNGAI